MGVPTTRTILSILVGKRKHPLGYTTYVFQQLEECSKDDKYIMCIRYPNWNCKDLKIGDKGFVSVLDIKAGEDTWFDGIKMVPYKYTNIQFMSFIDWPEDENKEYIM